MRDVLIEHKNKHLGITMVKKKNPPESRILAINQNTAQNKTLQPAVTQFKHM